MALLSHEIRKALGLSIYEFCLAEAAHELKGKATVIEIAEHLDLDAYKVESLVLSMSNKGYVTLGIRSNKVAATSLWKDLNKPPKKEKNKYSEAVSMLRKEVELLKPDYYYKPIDAVSSNSLIEQIAFKFKAKQLRDPSNEEIIDSFKHVIRSLPEFYANRWDIKMINDQFNRIVDEIKLNHAKRNSKTTGVGSGHHKTAYELLMEGNR